MEFDDIERILAGKQQHGADAHRTEAPQAARAGSDGHGKIEGEEALAALGLAADESDGLLAPELLDEPALSRGLRLELMGGLDREQVHDLLARPLLGAGAVDDHHLPRLGIVVEIDLTLGGVLRREPHGAGQLERAGIEVSLAAGIDVDRAIARLVEI